MFSTVRLHSVPLVLFVLLTVTSAPAAANETVPAAAAVMPQSIQVEVLLQSLTSRMLEASPTFKRQCDIIGASPSIVVKVRVVPAARNTLTRATTTFRRYTSGLTVADVEVPAASQLVELLAHEFEHVAEYVEGVDFKKMVRDRPDEAYELRDGSFETFRAVEAGRAAAREIEQKKAR
jgi:hypothetical protein